MQDIYNKPIIGGVLLGTKTVYDSIVYLVKNPAVILFFIYAIGINFVLFSLLQFSFVLLCLFNKPGYLSLPICDTSELSTTNLSGPEYLLTTVKQLLSTGDYISLTALLIFGAISLLATLGMYYYFNYAMVGMAGYIVKREKNEPASPTKELSLPPQKKQLTWHWTLISCIIILIIRFGAIALQKGLPLHHMIAAYKAGIVPMTSSIITLITFYAYPRIAAAPENTKVKMLVYTLFSTLMEAPVATIASWSVLSLFTFFLPHLATTYGMPNIATLLNIVMSLILPITQILLYERIKKFQPQG